MFNFIPENVDILLLGALVGYSGGGGVLNLTLSNWARDKGYGMGSRVGHIAGAVGGEKVQLASTGFIFEPDKANLARWRGWWRIVRVDQWGIFFVGALLGMMLPALLRDLVAPGTDIRDSPSAPCSRRPSGATAGPWLGLRRRTGVWIRSDSDVVEGARSSADILWTGSARSWLARRRYTRSVLRCAARWWSRESAIAWRQ